MDLQTQVCLGCCRWRSCLTLNASAAAELDTPESSTAPAYTSTTARACWGDLPPDVSPSPSSMTEPGVYTLSYDQDMGTLGHCVNLS